MKVEGWNFLLLLFLMKGEYVVYIKDGVCKMRTILWHVDNRNIKAAGQMLVDGEVVAFPTETVYGLGANAFDDEAVDKIFKAKGRPSDNPLIVHIADLSMLHDIVTDVSAEAYKLMEVFWPGALTIVMQKKEESRLARAVTANLDTVGVRVPCHTVARSLIRSAGVPLAAPSSNISGRPSPTTAKHVLEDLDGHIAGVVDGGTTNVGLESTVIDCSVRPPVVLRQGGVTIEQLQACIGEVVVADEHDAGSHDGPRAPGMKYAHYAPKATFQLVDGSSVFLQKQIDEAKRSGKRVGVLTVSEREQLYEADAVVASGSEEDLATVAEALYDSLRKFDHLHVDVIFGETFTEAGIGRAIMNRLRKAAGHVVIVEGQV